MKRIVLISCASKKRAVRSRAAELYTSTLFELNLKFAVKLKPDAIFILSAKHGLVALDDEIIPYDVTLNRMRVDERRVWANKTMEQLRLRTNLQQDHFIILAGERYRQFLISHLEFKEIPLEGLSIGKQLQYLRKQVCNE